MKRYIAGTLALIFIFTAMISTGLSFAEEETVKIMARPNVSEKKYDKEIEAGIVVIENGEEKLVDQWTDLSIGQKVTIKIKNGRIGQFTKWEAKKKGNKKIYDSQFKDWFSGEPTDPQLTFTITDKFKDENITIEARFDMYVTIDTGKTNPTQGKVEVNVKDQKSNPRDLKSDEGYAMATNRDEVEIKAIPKEGYEFDRWEFSREDFEQDSSNKIDKNSPEITINFMNSLWLVMNKVGTLEVTAYFKPKEGEEFEYSKYIKNIITDSTNLFKDFTIKDREIILKSNSSFNYGFFTNGRHNNPISNRKFIIETENIEKIKVVNPYKSEDGKIVGKTKEATSAEWAEGIAFSEIGIIENGVDENKIGFFKDYPLEFTFYTDEGKEFSLNWKMVLDPKDHIRTLSRTEIIRNYKYDNNEIILDVFNHVYKDIYDFNTDALSQYGEEKLIINTSEIESIRVANSEFNKDGYKGIVTDEILAEDWKAGVKFSDFGAEKDGVKVVAIDKENPPKLIFKTTYGEEFEIELKLNKFISSLGFEVDPNVSMYDGDVGIEIKTNEDEIVEGKFIDLIPGKTYYIKAKDGVRSEFTDWKLRDPIEEIDNNFKDYFKKDKDNRDLEVVVTEELIEKFQKNNVQILSLSANYNRYVSVEVELKEEKENNTSNSFNSLQRSISMMEYSTETREYKNKIESLKNSIDNNYTHKLEDNMGEAYIILKDKDGKIKEKKVSPLNDDIILANEGWIREKIETLELVAIPMEGYEFEKWQIITPAMTIEDEWDIPIDYSDPTSGVFAETKSPYIKTKLEGMPNKTPAEHRNRFRARAIFKPIGENDNRKIETISDIHKEYITGYTDISDVLLKSVEVKYQGSDEKAVIPVDWKGIDIEKLTPGEHTITGNLKDPRFSNEEVKLYLTVKKITGFVEPKQEASVINSNFFTDAGKWHKLPMKAKAKLNDGEKESVVELDIKWEEEDLNPEETHRINGQDIRYYKHGIFTATGSVKGYDDKIQYVLKVVPGNEVKFLVDRNFEIWMRDDYYYDPIKSIELKEGESILEPEEIPTRPGYISVGWYKDATWSNPLDLNAGKKFEFPKALGENEMQYGSFQLYNKWREVSIDTIKNIEIEVDSQLPDKIIINTEEGDTVEVDVEKWKLDGVSLSQPGEYTVKAIIEWKLKDEEIDVNIIVKDEIEEKPKYTINFNTNGGNNISSVKVEEGQKLSKPTDPIRKGYKFISWHIDETLTKEFDFDTPIIENLILYAKWEKEPTDETLEIRSVELIKDGKIISKGVIKGKTIILELPEGYDESIIERKHILKITGTEGANLSQDRGYDGPIEEWAAGNISNGIMVGQSKKFTLYKGDNFVEYTIEIVEASKVPEYTITFNTMGGSTISPIKVKEGETIPIPKEPTKEGYKFTGWYRDVLYRYEYDFNTIVKDDRELFAKWEKLDSPTPKPSEKQEPKIISFSLLGVPGDINHSKETIDVYLPFYMDLDYLVPDIKYEGDEISPSIGKPQNFNRTVYYTVSGKDYNSKTYKVYVDMPRDRYDRYDRHIYYEPENWYRPLPESSKGSKDNKDWYEITQEIKKKRLEEEETPSLNSKEVKKAAFNEVGRITGQSGSAKRDLSIKQGNDHMEIKLNSMDKNDNIKNQINIPAGVLNNLNELGFDYLKYNTSLVRVKIFPFMDSADGLYLNIKPAPSEKNNDIQYIWAKTKGAGKMFQIETNSTKAGLSFEMKLDKNLPREHIRVVKYNYMKGKFEDISPDKWSIINGHVYVEQVSDGIYGIIYKK